MPGACFFCRCMMPCMLAEAQTSHSVWHGWASTGAYATLHSRMHTPTSWSNSPALCMCEHIHLCPPSGRLRRVCCCCCRTPCTATPAPGHCCCCCCHAPPAARGGASPAQGGGKEADGGQGPHAPLAAHPFGQLPPAPAACQH